MLDYTKSFMETQFPVSKVSKESYKERKANLGQTLTGLGKWWGRKPLILVRAALLGVLLPVSDNPRKDREIFLKLLTMDNAGLLQRKSKNIPLKDVYALLTTREQDQYFSQDSTAAKPVYKKKTAKATKDYVQNLVFNRLSYDEKLVYCDRPEHIANLPEAAWQEINDHLETEATSLPELVQELGKKRYGHTPRIGDCFAGGGSIPFEAARLGADVYASDLNPIAALLTWSALHFAGASDDEIKGLRHFQKQVYDAVDKQVTEWGIEHNEKGHRADSYLYCHEVTCPEPGCGYQVPLAPSWIIGKGTRTVALLQDNGNGGFAIDIVQDASDKEFQQAEAMITIRDNDMVCPHCRNSTSIAVLRNDRKNNDGNTVYGLRKWNRHEFLPCPDDVFQERLYCIRYVEEYYDDEGKLRTVRYYTAPSKADLERENKVVELLTARFAEWQEQGYIPSALIEDGDKTDEPKRNRGWQYWHQLFNPRQLLVHGLFLEKICEDKTNVKEKVLGLLGLNKFCNWNSKLSRWNPGSGVEKVVDTYSNQALNTIYNFGTRTFIDLENLWFFSIDNTKINGSSNVSLIDARKIQEIAHIWITDPPYADAVNYHELAEFFLAWDKALLTKAFPNWYTDSKRILAVQGTGKSFNDSMIEIYRNLANHMPDNGTQVVMFTHQDVKVWAELAMILWSAGLHVVSAWNIATETDAAGLKQGNYVKGTVLLVLKKQTADNIAFQDELYDEIKNEVQFQIDSMRTLDDKEDPNFSDADYLLAAYASSLKVLTSYKDIDGIDLQYELSKSRSDNTEGPVESLINKAVKIANDYLIPEGIDKLVWRDLLPEEKFFIRGLELEMGNVYKVSAYQELARGFGVREYQDLFENFRANTVRLKTASEYKLKGIGTDAFGNSLIRQLLAALYQSATAESAIEGRNYLRSSYDKNNEYWNKRSNMMEVLGFLARLENISHMQHWHQDSYYAKILRENIKNDGV